MSKLSDNREIKRIHSREQGSYLVDAGPRPNGPKWVVALTTIIVIAVIIGLLALCYPEVFSNLI